MALVTMCLSSDTKAPSSPPVLQKKKKKLRVGKTKKIKNMK
jgi:hypothetical protein